MKTTLPKKPSKGRGELSINFTSHLFKTHKLTRTRAPNSSVLHLFKTHKLTRTRAPNSSVLGSGRYLLLLEKITS